MCDALVTDHPRLQLFLRDVSTADALLCPNVALRNKILLFNPYEEGAPLLRKWLVYRGFREHFVSAQSQVILANLATRDMEDRKNNPVFAGFVDFRPESASADFLAMWLSWYGVTAPVDRRDDREWWVKAVARMQDEARKYLVATPKTALRETFARLRAKEAERAQVIGALNGLARVLDDLSPRQYQEFLAPSQPPSSPRVLPSQKALAMLVGGSFIALPMVYDFPQRVKAFATDAVTEIRAATTRALLKKITGIGGGMIASVILDAAGMQPSNARETHRELQRVLSGVLLLGAAK